MKKDVELSPVKDKASPDLPETDRKLNGSAKKLDLDDVKKEGDSPILDDIKEFDKEVELGQLEEIVSDQKAFPELPSNDSDKKLTRV
jgi:hypothetical protein